MARRYKCPYCNDKHERKDLIKHIDKKHDELIPEDHTASRVVFNLVNKRTTGYCMICGKETKWREDLERYDSLCTDPKCKHQVRENYKNNMLRVRGTYNILNDPEQQQKMLSNRRISGKYKFSDGGIIGYTGSYEKKFLEFMDVVMRIPSKDIISPGPTMVYEYEGKEHFYIPDFYLLPWNLIIEIKDGGDNVNGKKSGAMSSSRDKTIAKERMITDKGEYNYIRLTNNNFAQLIEILMDMKEKVLDGDDSLTVKINETYIEEFRIIDKVREIINQRNWKRKAKKYDYKTLTEKVTPYKRKEVHTKSELDKFYKNNDYFIECVSGDEELCQIMSNILAAHYDITTPVEVYIVSGKDMNKIYDLYGDNAYQNDVYHVIIPLNTLKNKKDIVPAKSVLKARYFNDVVDNNEYREYKAGRHKKSQQIQWLIDHYNESYQESNELYNINVYNNSEEENNMGYLNEKTNYDILNIPQEIIDFNKELNSYDYGILINGKVETNNIDFTKYKTISIKDFEKYHAGVCWDFVNYEAKWFRDNKYKFNTYYIQIDDNKNCPSHTFLIFNYKGKYYYFESSWGKYQGIEVFNSEMDAVNTVCKRHNENFNKNNKYKLYCWKYNTNGLDSGLKAVDFMNKIYNSGKEININESYIWEAASKLTPGFKSKKSNINFKYIDLKNPIVEDYLMDNHKQEVENLDKYPYCGEIVIDADNDKLAGYIFIYESGKSEGYIEPLFVEKEYRGYGLGKKLLQDAINKYGAIDLSVDKNNEIAVNLYKKQGFVIVDIAGVRKGQYYMKLKSKLTKDDKVFVKEAFNPNSFKYIDLEDVMAEKYITIDDDYCGEIVIDANNNKLAGYVFVYNDKDNQGSIELFVTEEYRRNGLGCRLLQDAINKYNGTNLNVYKDNKIAINLYKKCGFNIVGDGINSDMYYMKLNPELLKFIEFAEKLYGKELRQYQKEFLKQAYESTNGFKHYRYNTIVEEKNDVTVTLPVIHAGLNLNNTCISKECMDGIMESVNDINIINESYNKINYNKSYDALIFDIGGVLDNQDKNAAFDYYHKYMEPDGITMDEFEDMVKGYFDFIHNNQNNRNAETVYKNTLDKKYQKYYNGVLIALHSMSELCDYTIPMLKYLKSQGYELYYLSNQSKWNWENHNKAMMEPIMQYFTDGIISCYIGLEKPDIRIFKLFLKKTGVNPETALFFDDKERNIKAANKVGIDGVVFTKDTVNDILRLPRVSVNRSNFNSKYLEAGDSCYNLDRWNPYTDNFLYITGISGSGKTTLGKDVAKNYNCCRVELDWISSYYIRKRVEQGKRQHILNELSKECPEAVEFLKTHDYEIREKFADTMDIITDFIDWFYNNFHNNGKLYIINGAQISYIPAEYFYDKPLIMKDINIIKTIMRRSTREIEHDKSLLRNLQAFYKAFKVGLTKNYRDANKLYKEYRKKLNKNASLVENTIYDDDPLSDEDLEYYDKYVK